MQFSCLSRANEQECGSEVAASSGKLLFGRALSCTVSVVKAGLVQDGAATSCIQREISVFSYVYEQVFWQIDLLPFCLSVSLEEMILPHLKSCILVVFCKSNCHWSLFQRQLC